MTLEWYLLRKRFLSLLLQSHNLQSYKSVYKIRPKCFVGHPVVRDVLGANVDTGEAWRATEELFLFFEN